LHDDAKEIDMATKTKARTRNNWGRVRKLPSGRYQAAYTDPRTRRAVNGPLTFSNTSQAQAWLAAQRTFLEAGTLPSFERHAAEKLRTISQGESLTLREHAKEWREQRETSNSPRTLYTYERMLESSLKDFADLPLADITPDMVANWVSKNGKTTPKMTRNSYTHLKALLSNAVRRGKLSSNPCDLERSQLPKKSPWREVYADANQVAKIIECASDEWMKAFLAIAFYSGLRRGEILELRKKDFQVREYKGGHRIDISVSRSVIFPKGAPVVRNELKTQGSRRKVTLQDKGTRLVMDYLEKFTSPNSLLFHSSTDPYKHVSQTVLFTKWNKVRKAAGFEGRLHDARAIDLTNVASTGAPTREIMDRGGHRTAQVAMRYQRNAGRTDEYLDRLA